MPLEESDQLRVRIKPISLARQLVAVLNTGTFLAQRWEEEDGVNLYHLPSGFLVELVLRYTT